MDPQHTKLQKFNKFLLKAMHHSSKNTKYSKSIRKSLEVCFKYMDTNAKLDHLDDQLLRQAFHPEWLCTKHAKHTEILCLNCLRLYCRQCELEEHFCDCYDSYQIRKLQVVCQKYLDHQGAVEYEQQKQLELEQIFSQVVEDMNQLKVQLQAKPKAYQRCSELVLEHQFGALKGQSEQEKMPELSEFLFEQGCAEQLQEQLAIQYVDWDYEERLNQLKQKYKSLFYELKSTLSSQHPLFYFQVKNAFDCTYNTKCEINYVQLLNQLKQNYQGKYGYLDICSVQFLLLFEDTPATVPPTFVSDQNAQVLRHDLTAILGYDIGSTHVTLAQRKQTDANELFYSHYQANGYDFWEDDGHPIKFHSIAGIEHQILQMLAHRRTIKLYIEKCPICQDDTTTDLFFLPCLHYFHTPCIRKHLQYNARKECPKCKKVITSEYAISVQEGYKLSKFAQELQKQLTQLIHSN